VSKMIASLNMPAIGVLPSGSTAKGLRGAAEASG
jgi:hypothetical protein